MYMKIFQTVIMSQNVIAYGFKKVRNKCYKNVRYAIFIVLKKNYFILRLLFTHHYRLRLSRQKRENTQ